MQGNLDEFLSARMGAGEDDDDAGPVIDVGSRASVSMQSGGAASVAGSFSRSCKSPCSVLHYATYS